MQVVVITGSTRGIGYGLADAFLERGCAVVVSGRNQDGVDAAFASLSQTRDLDCILGHPCDVGEFDQVQALWDAAVARFGQVDYWINNAGITLDSIPIRDVPPEQIERIVRTNINGSIYGSQVALKGMLAQGHGQIFIMEGMGSDGRKHDGQTLYGMTKYGLRYFIEALQDETANGPVQVGSLRPGMVVTELLIGQFRDKPDEWARVKRIFNILADRVETVTPYLAEQILANREHGARISWLNRRKLFWRFLTARFSRRDLFATSDMH